MFLGGAIGGVLGGILASRLGRVNSMLAFDTFGVAVAFLVI